MPCDTLPGRPVWAEIELSAITSNVRAIKASSRTELCAVVNEADAYGHGARMRLRHIANSAAAFSMPEARLDMVRAGLREGEPTGLRPAMRLVALVSQVRDHSVDILGTIGYEVLSTVGKRVPRFYINGRAS